MIECMAASLPVAATDNSGIRESLASANLAYLSPDKDHARMARNIITLAGDKILSEGIGSENKAKTLGEFDAGITGSKTAEVLNKLLMR